MNVCTGKIIYVRNGFPGRKRKDVLELRAFSIKAELPLTGVLDFYRNLGNHRRTCRHDGGSTPAQVSAQTCSFSWAEQAQGSSHRFHCLGGRKEKEKAHARHWIVQGIEGIC